MSTREITETLEEAGFTESQVEALMAAFTVHHHLHSIDEVTGLQDELDQLGDEECDPEEADEDDD